ncbi:Meckel syndrome type 1 protein-like isoform X1 [Photinus pyralis]|uniref:Meckel syndrome type 1 protein-like isoform X1 n=1 Tax=Photinus pyralis TaxID=7054 RepID=UPI00126758F9|nr:Meckel syndrome type 1 protein-like isoform X1 [Photinus pyralis]
MHKSTAIYRSPDEIINLKIRIRIREVGGGGDDPLEEIQTFRWQQKIFGQFERGFYLDRKNCATELERKYHAEVAKLSEKSNVVFSYVNDDGYEGVDDNCGKMHLMADLGDSQATNLCTVTYDPARKVLTMRPDFTQSEPYRIHIEGDVKRIFQYRIDDVSEKIPFDAQLKENEILDRINLHQQKLKLDKGHAGFELPGKNKLDVCLYLEILAARNFENDNVYVQYFIDLPAHWSCKNSDALKGCTQTSIRANSEDGAAHFGLPFEICLEYDVQRMDEEEILKSPYVYFEAVSKDFWDRFRTEGLAYTILPVTQAGVYSYELRCLRICPEGIACNLRRFFIGDFSNYDHITCASLPREPREVRFAYFRPVITFFQGRMNRYGVLSVGTGEISVRVSVLQQSQAFSEDFASENGNRQRKFLLDKLNTSVLIKSIEQVVAAFKVAKRKMVEARKNV